MSFVFPIMLGGLVVLAVPVLLHLLQRQKPKVLPFPAFRFLMQKHKSNQRSVRLRHLLLLLLRMLLLALICLAVARPQVGRPVTAVLVFDTSFSMQYQIAKKETRLKLAQKRGLELLDRLPDESRVAVFDSATNSADWESVTNARKRIQALKLRWDSTPVTTTLNNAFAHWQSWATDPNNPRQQETDRLLCVFSDGTHNCWEQAKVPEVSKNLDKIPPRLDQLQAARAAIGERIRLLQQLPKTIPPAKGESYNEDKLVQLWTSLQDSIPTYSSGSYPTAEAQKLLAETRSATRTLLTMLQTHNSDKLTKESKTYRQSLIQSLTSGLAELQGVTTLFLSAGVTEPVDLAIVDVQFPSEGKDARQRNTFGQGESFMLQVVVQATGKDFNSEIYCDLDDKSMKRPLFVKAGKKETVSFPVNCNTLRRGFHSLQVRLATSDLLPFNNTRFATFAIKDWRPILILTDDMESAESLMVGIRAKKEDRFQVDMRLAKYQSKSIQQPFSNGPLQLQNVLLPYFQNSNELVKDTNFQNHIDEQINQYKQILKLEATDIRIVKTYFTEKKLPNEPLTNSQQSLIWVLRPYFRTPSFYTNTKSFQTYLQTQIKLINNALQKSKEQLLTEEEVEDVLATLNRKKLANYQAVYLVNVNNPDEKLWKDLKTYTDAGGGLAISPPGGPNVKKAYNSVAAQSLMPAQLEEVVDRQTDGVAWNWNDGQLYRQEMFSPVKHWENIDNLKFVKILPRLAYFYWKVKADPEKSTPIVRFAKDDTLAIVERPIPTGKCVLLTTRLDRSEPAWNNYLNPDTTFCVALPNLLTRYLAGNNEEVELNFNGPDKKPWVVIPTDITTPTFDLIGPDKSRAINRKFGQTALTFTDVQRPGNYFLDDPDGKTVAAFSVNAPAAESRLDRVPLLDIEQVFGKESVINANENQELDTFFGNLLPPYWKLLPWLLVGLLVFLVLENLLSNWFYRGEKPNPGETK